MRAIILAAGINRRFFVKTPKSLQPIKAWANLPYNNMLERMIAQLKRLGISEIAVVVNRIFRTEFDYLCDEHVHTLLNETDVSITGSTISAVIGLEHFAATSPDDVLLMDADIVISERSMHQLIESQDTSTILVSSRINYDNEEVLVYADSGGSPRILGKGIGGLMSSGLSPMGESTGIIRLNADGLKLALEIGKWITGYGAQKAYGFSKAGSEHEEIWQYFFTLGKMHISRMNDDEIYIECDTYEDFLILENGLRIE